MRAVHVLARVELGQEEPILTDHAFDYRPQAQP
jgi:hypothetical protein